MVLWAFPVALEVAQSDTIALIKMRQKILFILAAVNLLSRTA